MTRTEWIQRCAERLQKLGGVEGPPTAQDLVEDLASEQAEKFGASAQAWQAPEDAADAEVAGWSDE